MPDRSAGSAEQQTDELKETAKNKLVLVVLDEQVITSQALEFYRFGFSYSIWNRDHETPFDCLDYEMTASQLLVVREGSMLAWWHISIGLLR